MREKGRNVPTGRRGWVWISGALVLLYGLVALDKLWVWTGPGPRVPEPPTVSDPGRLQQMEAEVQALAERLNRLEQAEVLAPVASHRASSPAEPRRAELDAPKRSEPARERPHEPEFDPAHERAEVTRTRERLDDRLEGEIADGSWAASEETRILEDLDGALLGSAYVVDTECRSTLCRVKLEHPEPRGLDRLLLAIMSKPAFAGRRWFVEQGTTGSGSGKMSVYLARRGLALPSGASGADGSSPDEDTSSQSR